MIRNLVGRIRKIFVMQPENHKLLKTEFDAFECFAANEIYFQSILSC